MKYLKIFENFEEEYYTELLSPEYSGLKFKSLFIPEDGSNISKNLSKNIATYKLKDKTFL